MSSDPQSNLAEQLRQLQAENANLKGQLAGPDFKAFEQIKELRSQNQKLSDDVKRLSSDGIQLAFKNRQLNQQVSKLQEELAAALSQGQDLNHSVEELQGELSQSREQILSHAAELERQKSELSQRQAHMAQLQEELTAREARIEKLEQTVNDFKEQFLSGDFEAVVVQDEPVADATSAYHILGSHLEQGLGIPGRTLVDQIYELLGVARECQEMATLEELFDTLQDTGGQIFPTDPENAAFKGALETAWSAISAGSSTLTASPAVANVAAEPKLLTPVDPAAWPSLDVSDLPDLPEAEAEVDLDSLLLADDAAETEGATAAEPVDPEPVMAAEPEPAAEAEPEPVAEAEPEPVAEAEPEPVMEAEPEAAVEAEPEAAVEAEPEAAVEAEPEAAVEAEPEAAVEAEPEAAVEAEPEAAVEPEAEPEPEPVAEFEASASDEDLELEALLAADLESLEDEQPYAEVAPTPVDEFAWVPPQAAAKFQQIHEALQQIDQDPSLAREMLEQALEVEVWVENESDAHLALVALKAGQDDITDSLTEALPGIEVHDVFSHLAAAQVTASGEVGKRLGLFLQFGVTNRADMVKSEASVGLAKRSLNRDFVAQIGNNEEEEVVEFLRETLLERSGLKLPMPSVDFEARLESTGPAAFVGTLRQALRAVDYTLFDFPELKVLTYDGDDRFLVDACAEPDLTLVFHRDIEGMPPEELCFLVFRHLIRMYRGHSQLEHQSAALDAASRLQLTQTVVELYLETAALPHPSLSARLDALDAASATFETECKELLLHLYQATGWEYFLYTREFLFDGQLFQKRLGPMADHAAARLVGITAATYGCLRDELLSEPDWVEDAQQGLQNIFADDSESLRSARLRVQRLWNEFLVEE